MQRDLVIIMNDDLIKYSQMFGDFPPLFMMMSYEHPVYKKLIKVAIDLNEPITAEMVEKEMKNQNVKCDLGD